MCRVHARVHACVCALCMFTHIGTAAYCTTVLLSTLRVSLCTRLHVHGNRGRGERKADARGVEEREVGQRREIRIRCLFVSFVLRDESEEGIGEGSEGWGEGNERRESYPCTVDIRLRFRFYTRLTCYV